MGPNIRPVVKKEFVKMKKNKPKDWSNVSQKIFYFFTRRHSAPKFVRNFLKITRSIPTSVFHEVQYTLFLPPQLYEHSKKQMLFRVFFFLANPSNLSPSQMNLGDRAKAQAALKADICHALNIRKISPNFTAILEISF